MNKEEFLKIVDYLKSNYPNIEFDDVKTKMWFNELQAYDYMEVMNRLKELMQTGYFQNNPPIAVSIVNGLKPIRDKINWDNTIEYCPICNKAFEMLEKDKEIEHSKKYEEHYNRCLSTRYIVKQNRKWFKRDISKGDLWKLEEQEFWNRYNSLLKYIAEHTADVNEKKRIEFIFNPPTQEETKEMLKI